METVMLHSGLVRSVTFMMAFHLTCKALLSIAVDFVYMWSSKGFRYSLELSYSRSHEYRSLEISPGDCPVSFNQAIRF